MKNALVAKLNETLRPAFRLNWTSLCDDKERNGIAFVRLMLTDSQLSRLTSYGRVYFLYLNLQSVSLRNTQSQTVWKSRMDFIPPNGVIEKRIIFQNLAEISKHIADIYNSARPGDPSVWHCCIRNITHLFILLKICLPLYQRDYWLMELKQIIKITLTLNYISLLKYLLNRLSIRKIFWVFHWE